MHNAKTFVIILMLVLAGTWTTTIMMTSDGQVVKADPWPEWVNYTISTLETNFTEQMKITASLQENLTIIKGMLNVLTVNGTINLQNLTTAEKLILYGLIDKNDNYVLTNETLGVKGNSTIASMLLLIKSNASLITKVDQILKRIQGNSNASWNIYDMENAILLGLVDKDYRYILHNGTLAYPHGDSAILVSLQNDQILGSMIRNGTQMLVTVNDENRDTVVNNLASVGNIFKNGIGNVNLWVAVLTIVFIFFVFYMVVLRERLRRYSPKLKEPACYGDPRVFSPDRECVGCMLKEDCERQIIAASNNLQKENEPQQKKKKLKMPWRKKDQEETEGLEGSPPPCYGQYLAGDAECLKCIDARGCMGETPGVMSSQGKEQPRKTTGPAPTTTAAANAFDALAGF